MGTCFGDDLVMAILSRLPGKVFVRCKSLSKSFHTLVSDFLSQNPNLSMPVFLYEFYDKGRGVPKSGLGFACSRQEHDENQKHVISNVNNVSEHLSSYNLENCQNGLLLFVQKMKKAYSVWNPFTNKWFDCPPSPPLQLLFESFSILAFDPRISPHFKVICFSESRYERELFFPKQQIRVDIFNSETGKWVHSWQDQPINFWYSTGVFLNGIVYLIGYSNCIVGFDVTEESFRVISFPESDPFDEACLGQIPFDEACLGVSGGYLHYTNKFNHPLKIWMLKDCQSGWILKHEINLETFTIENDLHISFLPIGFHPDFDIVFLKRLGKIISYDLNTTRIEELYSCSHEMTPLWICLNFYPISPCLYDALPVG